MWYILLFASVFQRQSQEPVSFSWKEWIKGDRCVVNLAVLVGRLILYRHGSNCHHTFASCHCFLASSVHEKGGFTCTRRYENHKNSDDIAPIGHCLCIKYKKIPPKQLLICIEYFALSLLKIYNNSAVDARSGIVLQLNWRFFLCFFLSRFLTCNIHDRDLWIF